MNSLREAGTNLLGFIKAHDLGRKADTFRSDRPIAKTITPADLVAEPWFGFSDPYGANVARFFIENGNIIGIGPDDYSKLKLLVDVFFKVSWVKKYLSRSFVEEQIFAWCMLRYRSCLIEELPFFVAGQALSAVQVRTVLVPIAFLEIERKVKIGDAQIRQLRAEDIDAFESQCVDKAPKQVNDVLALFEKLRSDFQGMAVVETDVVGDRKSAHAAAERIADEAIGFLRLFSAAAYEPRAFCPCAIAGSEIAPAIKLIMLGPDDAFSYREESKSARFWQLTDEEATAIENSNWSAIENLTDERRLTKFQKRLKTCLLSFSKGLTFPDFGDRLVYILSSLEGLLLKDSSEPIQYNLGERIAFAVSDDPLERRRIVANTKILYKIRSEYVHHRVNSFQEQVETEYFYENARKLIHRAIAASAECQDPQDFIRQIDDIKYGVS